MCFAAYPLTQAANRILGSTSYHSHFKREDINYGGIQHCITGFGSDDQITQIEACDNLNLLQSNKKSYLQNLNAGIPGTQNNQYNSVFQSWQLGGSLNIPISASSSVWNSLIVSISDPEFFTLFNRDKYMKEYHRTIIFNLGVVSGQWDKNQAKSWSLFTGNKQLELINAILTNTTPVNGFFDFRTLLDVMPIEGSYNLKGGNWPQTHTDSKFQTNGWGGEYRWTNPDASMGVGGEHGIYNAIDYMLFHNLYRLVFQPNLAYAPTSDCYCGNPISKPVEGSQGQIDATTSLNLKLAHLETCPTDVFTPVNQSINGIFNIEPKFPDYINLKIFTVDYNIANAVIISGGVVNVRNQFILCNSKTLDVQPNAKLNVEKREMIINGSSRVNNSGEIRIKSGTNITIKNLGKLTLNTGSKIVIEDGAKLIIDYGGILEYYNGAQIITEGENSEIIMRSSIKIMNTGTFKIDHSSSVHSGRLIFDGGMFIAEQPNTIIDLKGKSNTDEFIVIKPTRKLWITDSDISLFSIEKCRLDIPSMGKIEMEQPFTSKNVVFTSTSNNLGIALADNSSFTNCDFIDVYIEAFLNTKNTGKLNLSTCNFSRVNTALNSSSSEYVMVNGMGYTIYNCTFNNPRMNGIRSFNLTFPSTISTCTFTQNTDNGRGIKENSTAELIVRGCNFNNMKYGIEKYSGKLTLRCNNFQSIKMLNLSLYNGCILNMSSDDFAGYNVLNKTTDNKNILLSSAGIPNINNGYNFFDDNSLYILDGTLASTSSMTCRITASKNQWNSGNIAPLASKFNLLSSNIPIPMSYVVTTANPTIKPMCGFYDPVDPGNPNGKSLVSTDRIPMIWTSNYDSIRLDSAIINAMRKMELFDSLANDLEAVEIFNDVFTSGLSKTDSIAGYWLRFSLHHMKSALENAFSNGKISRENNTTKFEEHVTMYSNALMYMTDTIIDESNYISQFYHEMNKAHLFRLIGHSEIGLNIMDGIENCGLDSSEQQYLNYWKTEYTKVLIFDEIGVNALDSNIIIDTANYNLPIPLVFNQYYFGAQINGLFDIAYPNCEYYTPDKMLKEFNKPEFAIFPNPADELVNIILNQSMSNGTTSKLVFQSTDGKIVLATTYNETENALKTINVSSWNPGIYLYKYTIANGKTFMGKLVVK